MTAPATMTAWEQAQIAEREYWYPDDREVYGRRLAEEHQRQTWYAGLLMLGECIPESVIELGAGPQGLLSRYGEHVKRKAAVEPMALKSGDSLRYAERGVHVLAVPAEKLFDVVDADTLVTEVWMTNVLQHCADPAAVLAVAARAAWQRIRLFEWVYEPTSVVHLHTITPDLIDDALGDHFTKEHHTAGVCVTPDLEQRFVATVWVRP